jgi:hypothetical protein
MIDRTTTSVGARLLYSRLASPLTDAARASARLDAVDFFRQRGAGAPDLARVRAAVAASADAERALQRLSLGRGSPSDLVAVAASMCRGAEALDALLRVPGGPELGLEIGDTPAGLLSRLREREAGLFRRITQFIRPTATGGFNSLGQLHNGGSGGPGGGGGGGSGGSGGGAALDRREIVRRGWSPKMDRLIDLRSNIKGLFRDLELQCVRCAVRCALRAHTSWLPLALCWWRWRCCCCCCCCCYCCWR